MGNTSRYTCSTQLFTLRKLYCLVFLFVAACAAMAEDPTEADTETENVGIAQSRIVSDNAVQNPRVTYPAGHVLENSVTLTNGFNLGNGGSGGTTSNGINITAGTIAPADGSDL